MAGTSSTGHELAAASRLLAGVLVTLLVVVGCTTGASDRSGEARSPASPDTRTIVIRIDSPAVEYRMTTVRSTTGREAALGAGKGIGGGALVGLYITLELAAGTGGLGLLAAPFLVGGGAVIGGVVGAMDGAAGAEPIILRSEPLGDVEEAASLVAVLGDSDLAQDLLGAIASDARERTDAPVYEEAPTASGGAAADVEIVVNLIRIELVADDENDPDARLLLSAVIRVIGPAEAYTATVLYRGRRDELSDWAVDDAARFRAEIAEAVDGLAANIVSDTLMPDPEEEPRSCC